MEIKLKKESNDFVKEVANQKYEYGFTTDVHTEVIPKGLNEDVVRLISKKKGEPEWLLDFRLKAYRYWKTLPVPTGTRPRAAYRLPGYILLCRPVGEEAEEQGDGSRVGKDLRQARHPLGGAPRSERNSCGCCHGLRLCEDDVQETVGRERHHLHVYRRGCEGASRPREAVSRKCRTLS